MASEGRDLVALRWPLAADLPAVLTALWDEGAAVLPIPFDLPEPELRTIVARMRPTRLLETDRDVPLDDGLPVSSDTELVVLTSGTTGAPKGVELSRSALRTAARTTCSHLECDPGDRWLCTVPLTRIAGLSILARSEFLDSDPLILESFDPRAVDADDTCAYISLVPTMLYRLLESRIDLARFKAVLLGGAAAAPELIERAIAAGATIVRTYGMTETCGGVVYDGRPLDGVEVRVDEDDVVHLRSSSVMNRYRLDEDMTARALRDGWYRTGDVGRWNGLELQIDGREDDAIVTGGEKVFPDEVERALLTHPRVRTARVFAEPDEEWGQRVVARVSAGTEIDPESIRAFLKARLARHKVPSRVELEDV